MSSPAFSRFLLDAAASLLPQVLAFEQPADAVLARHFKDNRNLGARDRSALSDVVFAVLRQKRLLEFLLALPGQPAPPPLQQARRLAVLGVAWLAVKAAAAADAPVTDPAQTAAQILQHSLQQASADDAPWLQAIAERLPGALPEHTRHNLPGWLAARLQQQYGPEDFGALADALQQAAPLDLRVNTLKAKRAAAQQQLLAEDFASSATPLSPWGLRLQGKPSIQKSSAFTQGLVEVQDEGSQLLCLLADARRNETVADFCAGAGGKTLALGAMMRNTGRLYALDISASRLENLKPRLLRSGLDNVHTLAISHEQDERIQRLWGKVDRVLVDAPCSGTGTLRRQPDLAWRHSEASIAQLQQTQQRILQSAARLLKPGGMLVYATCSLLHAENDAVADWWEAQHPSFKPAPLAAILDKHKIRLPPARHAADNAANRIQLLPHAHGTDGFFAAVWQKKPQEN